MARKRQTKPRAPRSPQGRAMRPYGRSTLAVLWVATVSFAIFGGAGWLLTLWSVSPPLAVLIASTFAMAPFAAAAVTGPAMRGGGLLAWVCVLAFSAMDAAGNANAFWEFDKAANAKANTEAANAYAADLKSLKDTQATAQAKLDALPTSQAVCLNADGSPIGPKGCGERKAGLITDAARFTAERDRAAGALKVLAAPSPIRILPEWVAAAIFAAVTISMTGGFLGTHRAAAKVERERAKLAARPAPKASPKRKPKAEPAVEEEMDNSTYAAIRARHLH